LAQLSRPKIDFKDPEAHAAWQYVFHGKEDRVAAAQRSVLLPTDPFIAVNCNYESKLNMAVGGQVDSKAYIASVLK
jgi:hypothetical protein